MIPVPTPEQMRQHDGDALSKFLSPDNHALFDEVRMRLVVRDPVITWEQIAAEFGVEDVSALVHWFLDFKVQRKPTKLPQREGFRFIRDPDLRREYDRLRNREKELLTMATESPAQLAKVQSRIASLESIGVLSGRGQFASRAKVGA